MRSNEALVTFTLLISISAPDILRAQPTLVAAQRLIEENPKTILAAHSVVSGDWYLTGNRQGQALLRNLKTGAVTVFQAEAGLWAREVFLLDGVKTVGASQADHTTFWDAATGKEIGRVPARVYGFSHHQKLCFARTSGGSLQLYAYPSLQLRGALDSTWQQGVSEFLFSPDDHYLLLEINSRRPESESDYPGVGVVFSDSSLRVELYDLARVRAGTSFNRQRRFLMGSFTPDSRYVVMQEIFSRFTDSPGLPQTPLLFDPAQG